MSTERTVQTTQAIAPVQPRALTTKQQSALVDECGAVFDELMRAATPKNTARNYASQWGKFELFCSLRNLEALPAHPVTVHSYLVNLYNQGLLVSTVELAKASIASYHNTVDYPNPTTGKTIKDLMSGIKAKRGKPPVKKEPVSRDDLCNMVAKLPETAKGKRDKAILLMCFAGAFRRSELAALDMDAVKFRRDDVRITVIRSKTDQAGKGKYKFLPCLANDYPLCPVRALRAWLDVAGITSGAVFRRIDRHGNVGQNAVHSRLVSRLVKRAAQDLGFNPKDFGAHSLRSGFVTQGVIDRVPDGDMTQQTGQTVQTLQGYKQAQGEAALRATRVILGERAE